MSWLSNTDLEAALEDHHDVRVKQAFRGIYPNDSLPTLSPMKPPLFLIVNTDPHNLPGRHWKVIYIDEHYHGEVFDSLALPLSNHVMRFMNHHTVKWKTNRHMIQHPQSTQCGVYVLYYVTHRLNHASLQSLCQTFSSNLKRNEKMMSRFYHRLQ